MNLTYDMCLEITRLKLPRRLIPRSQRVKLCALLLSGIWGYKKRHCGLSGSWDQFGGECEIQDWFVCVINDRGIVPHNLPYLPVCYFSSQ